jgi:3-phosphoshikimate 1-carboxyvinyltransferase
MSNASAMTSRPTTDLKLEPASKLVGHYTPPPDKSIAHRALLLAALASGRSTITPISRSADVASTVACLRQLGVSIETTKDRWVVDSPGMGGWTAPERALDCGNSGTTMRLLSGCLAGRSFDVTLIGDESLSRRPMARIAAPLRRMGATIELSPGDTAPIHIHGSRLRGIEYRLPIASAQVKSAVLLAGLDAQGETIIIEPEPTRDHTERMLAHAGVDCQSEPPPRPVDRREQLLAEPRDTTATDIEAYHRRITLGVKRSVRTDDWRLPGDFSAAAFFIVAAVGAHRADLIVAGVGLNPTRTGLLKVLRRMGAETEQAKDHFATGEPIGQLRVSAVKSLKAIHVTAAEAPIMIDELPILAVLAARAEGVSVIRGAPELRHKESDRITAVTKNLRAMGAKVAELEDGWAIEGPTTWHGATIDPCGDHRIAMAFSVAALWADSPSVIQNADVVGISDPDFYAALTALAR